MKKAVTITIDGTAYPLKFGYRAMNLLGKFLNIETYDGTAEKVGSVIAGLAKQEKEGGNLPFEVLDVIGLMVLSATVDEVEFDKDDVVDAIFEDMAALKPIVEAWAESMPKAKPEKKSKVTPSKPQKEKAA